MYVNMCIFHIRMKNIVKYAFNDKKKPNKVIKYLLNFDIFKYSLNNLKLYFKH